MTDLSPATILVVDDEPEILTALEDLFGEDYRVLTAGSGAKALEILAREPEVAVIISDQRMPEMTGDVFLARAREFSRAEALLLTGYADLDAVISALNNGRIAGYAPKPWEPAALRSLVASAFERRRLARALETERALLRGLFDFSPDAISFKDTEGRFVRLNAAKATALGASVEACLGRKESDFLPPDTVGELARSEREVVASRQPVEALEQRQDPGQVSPRWVVVSRIPILDGDGNVSHLATIERDVTEQRELEARLRQADKMQALGTMAGGVAHDFNNLLTAILGSLQLVLRAGVSDARQRRLLENATLAAERGSALTQRLLSFSRKRELALRSVNVNQLIREMDDLLVRSLGGVVQVEKRLDPKLWTATVDPEQLELAVLNLCINSRDAMPTGGTITIATRNLYAGENEITDLAAGEYIAVSVADTGSGMSQEVLARAFEPFFTTKEVGKGTGLGLSMVYGLTRQSGGTARITSVEGEGTTVELILPRSTDEAERARQDDTVAPPAARTARVLVVDDEPSVREITAAFLVELGHQVIQAVDGLSALEVLRRDREIDLVVADLAMPRMTGLDLAAQARELQPSLPILLVTGYADLTEASEDFPILRKPFRQADLARCLAELMGRRS